MIRFNRPYITGREMEQMATAIADGRLSGDGAFTKLDQAFFADRYGFANNLLTTSGTDALEMAAILADIAPGDEVILPSYTFVSTANAFVLRGARPVFIDSYEDHPNMDHGLIEAAITDRTKAIVVMHYGGVACEMDAIMALAAKHALIVVEDAAHAIDSYYKDRPLGGIGHLACFSFHETKNIQCGEGGLLVVTDPALAKRAEVIREKGTDRSAFFRGEIDKYGWIDIGSSFLASEITAAFLHAQLMELDTIQTMRKQVWEKYAKGLVRLGEVGYGLPWIPEHCTNNGHLFHLVCPSLEVRTALIAHLDRKGIRAVFHYQPLHTSAYHLDQQPHQPELPNATRFGDRLVRLPLFAGLTPKEQELIIHEVLQFAHLHRT
ncbi:MAG: dTDP-4-amino-4,6-dideoxygalactose transaminase [Flavobacteriales bacterium]